MKGNINLVNVIKFAGAYVAFIIGSGFATGQEVMQFYTSYGVWSLGVVAISMFLFSWVGGSVMAMGYDHIGQKGISPYKLFCGKYLGAFYEVFVILFLFGVVVVMISGAGATLNEYYGLDYYIGSILMVVLVFIAYMIGVNKLIDIIGLIGPMIIIFSLIVAIGILIPNMDKLANLGESTNTITDMQAAPKWWISGILYSAYNIFGSIIFLFTLGQKCTNKKEAITSGVLGGVLLTTGALFMNLALLVNIEEVSKLAVPTLSLAKQISPILATIFSVLLIGSIFSTAAPMFWTVCNKIVKEDSPKAKFVALGLIALLLPLGQLNFGALVGFIYPYTGYLGMLLFVCLAYKQLTNKKDGKTSSND